MVKIQANASGTRSIDISEEHIETIRKYELLENIVDSNGIIDETVLEKLRLHVRAILETQKEVDRQLLDLCLAVIYNSNMKAFALNKLIELVGRKQ